MRRDGDRDRMTILTVRHLTTYSYAAPVRLGEHRMMLRPRDSNDQRLLEASLTIEPEPAPASLDSRRLRQLRRHRGFPGETRRLAVENIITLEHLASDQPDFLLEDRAAPILPYYAEEMPDLARAIERHYPDPAGPSTAGPGGSSIRATRPRPALC